VADDANAAERKTNVFISYSRKDGEAADRLHAALTAQGFNPYLDKHDIAAGEDWKARLGGLIDAADTMVFIISPDSIASDVCDWEINHAELRGKRILPVVARDPGEGVPQRLRRLNYVFMRSPDEEAASLPRLAGALAVDIGWIRAHTRYGDDATEWDGAGRPGRLLLRGAGIGEAERWRDTRPATAPQLTETQSAFIAASRRGATNRQRGWIAGSLGIAAVAIGLSVYAFTQQQAADASRKETTSVLATSDFRQGSELADIATTAPDGIAFLARAARAGDRRAATRLWTLWQQRSFWLPLPDETSDVVEKPPPTIPADIAERFATVDFDGQQVATNNLSISADGLVVFAAIGGIGDPAMEDVRVRVYHSDGTPIIDWLQPEYKGEMYLAEALGVLSPQGRYLALEARGWREASTLRVYDLAAPQQPISAPIVASGPLPGVQGANFPVLEFRHSATATDADEPPLLLTGSARGDAKVYWQRDTEYEELAGNSHRSPVTLVTLDEDSNWLMSASADRFVAISELSNLSPIGSPVRVEETVLNLSRTGNNEVTVDQAKAIRTRFAFQPPIAQRYEGTASAAEAFGPRQEACFLTDGLQISEGPVLHPSGLTLSVEEARRAVVTHRDGTVAVSPKLLASIMTICASADGQFVSLTTDDFKTEIWTADFSRRIGPALDEGPYLDVGWPTPIIVDWVQLSPDAKLALTRSSFWDPPNMEYFWLTLWDTGTGLPLSEHKLFVDEGNGDEITSATIDPDLGWIAYLSAGKPTGAGLDLTPPDPVMGGLADYMEGVVGQKIDPTGLTEPVANRSERLAAGNALLRSPGQ
jgi:hypothetical protein